MGLSEIGKGLIDVGNGFVLLAKKLVEFAQNFLTSVRAIVAVGSQILNAGINWLGENLFKIDELKIWANINNDFNACAGIKLKCVILNFDVDYEGISILLHLLKLKAMLGATFITLFCHTAY